MSFILRSFFESDGFVSYSNEWDCREKMMFIRTNQLFITSFYIKKVRIFCLISDESALIRNFLEFEPTVQEVYKIKVKPKKLTWKMRDSKTQQYLWKNLKIKFKILWLNWESDKWTTHFSPSYPVIHPVSFWFFIKLFRYLTALIFSQKCQDIRPLLKFNFFSLKCSVI